MKKVIFVFCDWKLSLWEEVTEEDKKVLSQKGYVYEELDVNTGDSRVGVIAPEEFLDWYQNFKGNNILNSYCAMEIFQDSTMDYREEKGDEFGYDHETIINYYFGAGELWVETDEDSFITFKQWFSKVMGPQLT